MICDDAVVELTTCASHPVPAVEPTMIVVPAARPVGTVVVSVIAVVPTVTADELIVPAATGLFTPEMAYSVCVTPTSSNVLPPAGICMLLFCVIWDPPTYTGYRPVFEIRTVDGALRPDGAVKIHVGVTAGFTLCGVPGGKLGIWAS